MSVQTEPGGVQPRGAAEQRAIPRNPGRHDLGMRATLIFPNRDIVERY